jgi:hypothetical protein
LGNCITSSSLNPKTRRFYYDVTKSHQDQNWKVEEITKQQMENGNTITNIDHKEVIQKLKVFDPSSSTEEITKLLNDNQGDFVSVMNILKEKSSKRRLVKRLKERKIIRGNMLKEKILEKLRARKFKGKSLNKEENQIKIENVSDSVEKPTPKCSDSEVNTKVMAERIMMCKSKEDVQNVVMEIAEGFNNTVKQLKRSKSENYILMMGIEQRRKITQNEIKKRVEVEQKLKETQLRLGQLVQSQNYLQQSFNGGWRSDHFGREGF